MNSSQSLSIEFYCWWLWTTSFEDHLHIRSYPRKRAFRLSFDW